MLNSAIWQNKNIHILLLIFLAITVIFGRLQFGGLASFDDCYYAEKAKEIIVTGDWMTMQYNYKHLASDPPPPLYMWWTAVMFRLFGVNEYTAKLTSALSGLSLIILIYFIGKKLYDHWVGLFSSVILLTTNYFLAKTQRCMVDILLALLITLAVWFFIKSMDNKKYLLLFGFSTGLAVLTKSVMGLFPLIIAFSWMLVPGIRKKINIGYLLMGILVMLAVSTPWFIMQWVEFGNVFLYKQFTAGVFNRSIYGTMGVPGNVYRWTDYFKYIPIMAGQSMPWFIFAVMGFVKLAKKAITQKDTKAIMLMSWAAIIFICVSIPTIKRPWYIISIYPVLSIIAANLINQWLDEPKRMKTIKALLIAGFALNIFMLTVPVSFVKQSNADIKNLSAVIRESTPSREEVVLYKLEYWTIQNPLLFYSDRPASKAIEDEDTLAERLKTGTKVVCLANVAEYDRLKNKYHLIKKEGKLVLFSKEGDGVKIIK